MREGGREGRGREGHVRGRGKDGSEVCSSNYCTRHTFVPCDPHLLPVVGHLQTSCLVCCAWDSSRSPLGLALSVVESMGQ